MTSGAVLAVDSHTAPRMLTWLAPACQRLPTCGDKLQITWGTLYTCQVQGRSSTI
jgi:hypothetical protein